jgi:hypothetical protein
VTGAQLRACNPSVLSAAALLACQALHVINSNTAFGIVRLEHAGCAAWLAATLTVRCDAASSAIQAAHPSPAQHQHAPTPQPRSRAASSTQCPPPPPHPADPTPTPAGQPSKRLDPSAINVLTGNTYEQEFDLELKRMKVRARSRLLLGLLPACLGLLRVQQLQGCRAQALHLSSTCHARSIPYPTTRTDAACGAAMA